MPMTTTAPTKIGRFDVVRALGRGSQGSVYLAKDPSLDRYVAVKLLQPDKALLGPSSPDEPPQEGRISSRLRHPNIVSVFDAGVWNDIPYLVFEYVQGRTLRELLAAGSLPFERAVALIGPILEGIACAHAEGVIHLDLSPRNILVDRDGVPRIMDFGLSTRVGTPRERSDTVVGTLRYMAPEHFENEELGPYTDVFALASTFYELVCGRPAMEGDSASAIVRRLTHESVDMSRLGTGPAAAAFARFLEGGFEKDYRARYQDGAAMKQAFDAFVRDAVIDSSGAVAATAHSTVDFLLRRMQRKQDFPTISRTLTDINRLTGKDSRVHADKLAKVILRDYALTSKLLKLVNSAFYGGIAGEIKHISRAVVLLGFDRVRMTANSLTFFSHLRGAEAGDELKDAMVRSFLSGLIARHLAQRLKLPDVEEAFICGLFQNLGENLALYYFPDEHAEAKALMKERSLSKAAASRGILGVTYAELGAAVARIWKLPDSIVECILWEARDLPQIPRSAESQLRAIVAFSNELCDIASWQDPGAQDHGLAELADRYRSALLLGEAFARRLLEAGLERLTQYSEIFEIDPGKSAFCRSVQAWIENAPEADAQDAAVAQAAG